jgi:hypothetical protein
MILLETIVVYRIKLKTYQIATPKKVVPVTRDFFEEC